MSKKIEHIGLAVVDLDSSAKLFEKILNTKSSKSEFVEEENVKTKFLKIGETKLELLEGFGKSNPINNFIKKRGPGIHHIALEVEDIHVELSRLKKEGFNPIHDSILKGANNKLISFLHPKETQGVLIEICQKIKNKNGI